MAALHPCLVAVCEAGVGTGFTLAYFFPYSSLITELTKVLQIKTPNNQTHDEKQNITQMNHDEVETTETSKSA